MKTVALAFIAFAPAFAFAHGSITTQASDAIKAAGNHWAGVQPPEVRKAFRQVTALKTGHEMFTVTISLTNDTQFAYECKENETVNPVVWECAAK